MLYTWFSVCVCERVVCVCEREREWCVCVCVYFVCVCVCVFVCVWLQQGWAKENKKSLPCNDYVLPVEGPPQTFDENKATLTLSHTPCAWNVQETESQRLTCSQDILTPPTTS